MHDEISFLGLAGTSDLTHEYFFHPLFVCAYSSSHNNVQTFIVSVCFTKAEADKRQCFEIANGLHTYFSMQGMS
jgi:hypothetical protein